MTQLFLKHSEEFKDQLLHLLVDASVQRYAGGMGRSLVNIISVYAPAGATAAAVIRHLSWDKSFIFAV